MPTRRSPLPGWAIARRQVLGQRIAQVRRAAGLSQEQLGNLVGLDRRTIQRYESGERDPRFVELLLIADAAGTTIEALVCE